MSTPHTIAVTAATGAQGSAIAHRIKAAGHHVLGLSRSEDGADSIRAAGHQARAIGDPADADAYARAFHGADSVIYTSPIDYRPGAREALTRIVVAAAAKAGVRRLVLNLAAPVFEDYDRPVATVLRDLRQIVREGPVPSAVLAPTLYTDNLLDEAMKQRLSQGALPLAQPPEARIAWISHRTLGDFAVAATTSPIATGGRQFDIGGGEAVSGPQLAALLSARLGRPIHFVALAPDAERAGLNAVYGPPTGDDMADLYRYVADHPDALAREGSLAAGELGVHPETPAAWIERQAWGEG